MRIVCALAVAIATAAVLAPAAGAVPLVLTDGPSLVRVDTNSTTTTSAPTTVTGMQPLETLVGIDQRPATGQLYGIGSTGRVYVLDPMSGAATALGTVAPFTPDGAAFFGTDINPAADRIRLVSSTEQNVRLS